jgi:hypothetical protein
MSVEYDYNYTSMWIDPYSPECVIITNNVVEQRVLKQEQVVDSVVEQVCEEWKRIWID